MENNENYKEKVVLFEVDVFSFSTVEEKINKILNDGWKIKNQTFSSFYNSDCILSVCFYCDKFIDLTKKPDAA